MWSTAKRNDMSKINNSYETEQSTSNSSSSDGLKSLTLGWDSLHNYQQLRDYLYPPLNEAEQTPFEQMKNDQHENDSLNSGSKHSDFLGFSTLSNETSQIVKSTNIDHVVIEIPLEIQNEPTSTKKKETDSSGEKSDNSEEFSDQDVRFQIDMSKPEEIFDNLSQYTIEAASSDDDVQHSDESASDDTLNNLPTLSVNENSSNAIDLTISNITYVPEPELIKDLSFNGKLNTESKIIETNDTSGISFGKSLHLPENPSKPQNETLNTSERSDLEIQLQLETSRELINERSPDLFSDEDEDEDDIKDEAVEAKNIEHSTSVASASISFEEKDSHTDDYIEKNEKQISKRLQGLLSGILPPPSVTYVDHDITSLLTLYNKNVALMGLDNKQQSNDATDDQTKFPSPAELDNIEWPHIERVNSHGLHYNRTKYTNNIEIMYMKLVERNIGQETGSSFTYNVSMSAKRKPIRKVIASPGNRLSHLARRRSVFSSATLQSQSQLSNLSKLGRKPCVIDASKITKKEKVTTPRRRGNQNRRTPGRKTPGSLKKSAKKAILSIPKPAIATRETSKRALFLSPAQEEVKPNIAPEFSRRVEKSKRALFSPPRRLERSFSNISCTSSLGNSNTKFMQNENSLSQTSSVDVSTNNLKRKRECDDGENMEPNRSKLAKYNENLTTARLKSSSFLQNALPKAASESSMYQNNQMSASHKQKLLWAVSTALKKKSITTSHENFNHFASVLAKVVKRLYLETMSTKSESTSGTMLRLADKLVFYVMQGKTVDEIYLDEKTRIESAKMVNKRPSGYINRDEYLMRQDFTNKLNTSTQSNAIESMNNENDVERKPLTNSTSKSNVGVNALRENHDSKSAQKSTSNISFSGRNQKNLSPYNDKSRSASHLNNRQNKIIVGAGSNNSLHSNIMKVKRQISFDN